MTRRPPLAASALVFAALVAAAPAARADWPLIWDYDGRADQPVAAELAPNGDLLVLVEAWAQGQGAPHGVLLRVDAAGTVVAEPVDAELRPTALAVADDGRALALGRAGADGIRVTAYDAAGAIDWSRTRSGVTLAFPFEGPESQPAWDGVAAAWRVPVGIAGDLAVVSWSAAGDPLPDRTWSPPAGEAVATSVVPRAGGGLLVAGWVETTPPGWWTVALDADGAEAWRWFEDGDTAAGIFSGAFPVQNDAQRVTLWADDETGCGLFSLRLWSLDAATGAPLWDATWPPPGGCTFLIPDAVVLAGGRILAAGATTHFQGGSGTNSAALAFDPATGASVWEREFDGATTVITTDVASSAGEALVATTLFPPVNPGPTPLWLAGWDRDGQSCGPPVEILAARVIASAVDSQGDWLVVGHGFQGGPSDDTVLQRFASPCQALFRDGFESGDTSAWSSSVP